MFKLGAHHPYTLYMPHILQWGQSPVNRVPRQAERVCPKHQGHTTLRLTVSGGVNGKSKAEFVTQRLKCRCSRSHVSLRANRHALCNTLQKWQTNHLLYLAYL